MARRLFFSILIAGTLTFAASADVAFSIRYHDKNIYYPGDRIDLKLTLTNTARSGEGDESFYLADDPRQSFGFDLRTLTGDPTPLAEGYTAALNEKGAYRVVHLAPGQELSLTVTLNDWVDLEDADQYRLTGFFYPRLRGRDLGASQADSVLDLTLLPETNRRWEDELDAEIASALMRRNLDPWNVVRETLDNRSESRFNRAILYLDTESLAAILPNAQNSSSLEQSLLEGAWSELPGFEHPAVDVELVSSQVFTEEANVRLIASYEPFGERFDRDLRFYLHKKDGYWSIRRIEALASGDADPQRYGALDLNPPEVVSELIRATVRGDWDIALRYYDTDDLVRNLPEYSERWKDMSSSEHRIALADYRERLISGRLDPSNLPLADMEDWVITSVNYTDRSGSVVVRNTKTHSTAEGPLEQDTLYTFRLERSGGANDRWIVVRYDTARIGAL